MRRSVWLPIGRSRLAAELTIPRAPIGVVLFAHGCGSGRDSPRNRRAAQALQRRGIATFLFDLLTARERRRRVSLFDIPLLAKRVAQASDWLGPPPPPPGAPPRDFSASPPP